MTKRGWMGIFWEVKIVLAIVLGGDNVYKLFVNIEKVNSGSFVKNGELPYAIFIGFTWIDSNEDPHLVLPTKYIELF